MHSRITLAVFASAFIGLACGSSSNNVPNTCGNGTSDAGELCFADAVAFSVGEAPAAVAIGDFDGDGNLDIVTANAATADVSVLLGNGDGTFGAESSFDVGNNPVFVVASDLNGDGKADIATTNQGSDNISLLFGNGDGTFDTQALVPVGDAPSAFALGNLNGDTQPDIVCASSGGNNVRFLKNDGSGNFSSPEAPFSVGTKPRDLHLQDLNGDGELDVISINEDSDDVSVLLGNGDGTFAVQDSFDAGVSPLSASLGDVDGDGAVDLIAANADGLVFLKGDGAGSFETPVDFGINVNPPDVILLNDLNGDSLLDSIATSAVDGVVNLLAGDGTSAPGESVSFSTGAGASFTAAGDFNGDGQVDLVTANAGANNVSILLADR